MTNLLLVQLRGQLAQISQTVDQLEAEGQTPTAPPATAPPTAAPAPPAADDHPGFADEGAFYDWLRDNDLLGPEISATEFRGCNAITRACAEAKWPVSWTAYALATAYLETNHQMIPVREAYWLSESAANAYFRRMYDINGARPDKARELGNTSPGDGAKYPGRGYPQLTGKKNYLKAGTALGVDLIGHPELALEPGIAAQIMIRGMREGWFTGRDIDDDLPSNGPATKGQFIPSRDIINGKDRQNDVADYAVQFQQALQAGGWRF